NPAYNDYPVVGVTWEQANAFCAWRTEYLLKGLGPEARYVQRYRLPTEAEWEYAARGGVRSHNTVYPGTRSQLWECCWYGGNSDGHSHPVGRLNPNELGLYDMGGNVLEWCADWMESYSDQPQNCPQGPRQGDNRILRGGCFNSPTWGCSVFERSWYLPDFGYSYFGFRLLLDSTERDEE
ncbi:MAG: SUMF1/EgtB/PvdO family nonheme iron enzyme, partial [Bacteroidales bacterium]|nr:SUMF1/EgtB/PvdO family nonheme iron enzyme [Bacteroidales bacterium]